MSEYSTLNFEKDGNIALITLNRPDAANGINMDMGRELMQVAIKCGEDKDIRAVLLTGEGKMFCAGGDLKSFEAYGDDLAGALKELTTYLHAANSRFARMDAPFIIAVNGTAAGAGFSLAASGDFVFAAESAKFTMAYTAAGLSPDGSSSYYLPRLIGARRTMELMMTNRRLSAQEALDWGLVNQVVADDQLLAEARALAENLAKGPTGSFGSVKRLVLSSLQNGLETQMEIEAQEIARAANSADGKEGIAAFIGKRKPEFTGK